MFRTTLEVLLGLVSTVEGGWSSDVSDSILLAIYPAET